VKRQLFWISIGAAAAAASLSLGLLAAFALAQQPNTPAAPTSIPRDNLGRADLSGMWLRAGGNFNNEPAPYKPEALAKHQEFRKRLNIDDPIGHCYLGIPRSYTMPVPFKIVQTANEVIFLYEMFKGIRIVPTDGSPHPEDHEPSYMGSSVGKWEGDTLVMDVRGFNGKTWLGGGASHHSDQLQITERLTRTAPDRISYEATLTDPVVFTKPWTIRNAFALRPGERIREYECNENNLVDEIDPSLLPK
jgi:hypothetical protein